MSVAVSVRMSDTLAKELAQVSKETERPRSFHVQKALEAYLEDYADLRIAMDRLRDPRQPTVSSAELRKKLGL